MEKTARIIIGLLSLIPLIFWANAIAHYWNLPLFNSGQYFEMLGIANLCLLVYFLYKLLEIETIGSRSKLLWIIRFLIAGFIAMPIFWYYFILQKEEYALFNENE